MLTLTVDLHVDTPWQMTKRKHFDLRRVHIPTAVDFPRMKVGELQAAVFALYLPDSWQDRLGPSKSYQLILDQIGQITTQAGCRVARDTRDAKATIHSGLVPIFLGLEGGRLIDGNLGTLASLHTLGVRYLTLTHNRNTEWADSATDLPEHGGLTDFGECIVRKAMKLGILLDISHASDATARAVLGLGNGPVIASHSGCRKLVNHPRNLSDALIKSIAALGGVIGIPFARRFIFPYDVVDHIDHAVQLVGPSHVAIGSDLDGAVMIDSVPDVSAWAATVVGPLLSRGYSDADIGAIAGGNALRLFT